MPASIGATRIPISPLTAPLPEGAVLNFPQGKAILNSAAAAGTTRLEVKPLTTALPSGAQVTWGGEIILHHDTYTYITLQQPLSGAIPSGTVLEFPSGRVIVARDALAGAIALYVHPAPLPKAGSTTTYTHEVLQPPYQQKLIARGGSRCGGATIYYPYSLILKPLIARGGSVMDGLAAIAVFGGATSGGKVVLEVAKLTIVGGAVTSGNSRLQTLFVIGGANFGGRAEKGRLLLVARGGAVNGGRIFAGRESILQGGAIAGGSARRTVEFVQGGATAGGGAEITSNGRDELELLMFGDYSELEALLINPFA